MTASEATKRNISPQIIRLAITGILLFWVINRVGFDQVFDALQGADFRFIGISILVFQVGVGLRSFRWWLLLRGSSFQVGYRYVLGLMYITELYLGATPTSYAGDLVRILEFKKGNSKVVTAGIVVLDRMLGLAGMVSLALIALAMGSQQLPVELTLSLTAIALSILMSTIVILQGSIIHRLIALFPVRFSRARENWLMPFTQALTGAKKAHMLLAFTLSILNTVITIFNHYLVAVGVGIKLGIGLFFIFSPIVNLSLMLPTISGLGLREVGYQILLGPFDVSANIAIALGIGVYLSRLSASLIGGVYYLLWNLRRKSPSQ
jgi:hypothetical protein